MIVALSCVLLSAIGARAEEAAAPSKDWKVEAGGDYFTEYIFRGYDVSKNQPLFMPHALLGWKWFTATWYGYYSPWDQPDNKWYYENDFTLDATVKLGKFTLTGGALYYYYPDGKEDGLNTTELYGIVAYDFPLLNPKLSWYQDVDEFHTSYITLSINHPFDVSKPLGLSEGTLTITPSAALNIEMNGWSKYETDSNTDFNDALLGVSANWAINKYLSVHAGVQLAVPMGQLRNSTSQDEEIIGNVGVTLVF